MICSNICTIWKLNPRPTTQKQPRRTIINNAHRLANSIGLRNTITAKQSYEKVNYAADRQPSGKNNKLNDIISFI